MEHVPILVRAGEPFEPSSKDDYDQLTADLRARMSALLDEVQRDYPEKPGPGQDPFWLPAHLGGTPPTPEAALQTETG